MIKNFRHVCVLVKDLNRSLKFYTDVLGLKCERTHALEGEYPETVLNIKGLKITYAKLRDPSQPKNSPEIFELHLWENPKISPKPSYNHVSFTVDNIDSEYKRLKDMGVKFISKPMKAPHGYTKICFGYDPDGNLIEFVEELKS